MGEPAMPSPGERAARLALASKIVGAVRDDASMLAAVYDYRDDEQAAIDATKFGDLDACSEIEGALFGLAHETTLSSSERDRAVKALDHVEAALNDIANAIERRGHHRDRGIAQLVFETIRAEIQNLALAKDLSTP